MFAAKVLVVCSCCLSLSIVILVIPPKCVFRSKSLVESLSKKQKKRGKKKWSAQRKKVCARSKREKFGSVLHLYLEKSLFVLWAKTCQVCKVFNPCFLANLIPWCELHVPHLYLIQQLRALESCVDDYLVQQYLDYILVIFCYIYIPPKPHQTAPHVQP